MCNYNPLFDFHWIKDSIIIRYNENSEGWPDLTDNLGYLGIVLTQSFQETYPYNLLEVTLF